MNLFTQLPLLTDSIDCSGGPATARMSYDKTRHQATIDARERPATSAVATTVAVV